jgi:hypothetical protein
MLQTKVVVKINTNLMLSNFFPGIVHFLNVWKKRCLEMMWFACRVAEKRKEKHTHTCIIFKTYCFIIDQFHLVCKLMYGNACRNWATTHCFCHYSQFSWIICVKALSKLIFFFFVPLQDEAFYMQANTFYCCWWQFFMKALLCNSHFCIVDSDV